MIRKRVPLRNPAYVAQGLSEPAAGYYPGSAAYSPGLTDSLPNIGRVTYAYQMESPEKATQGTPEIHIPRPPLPSVYGEPGRSQPLGYSTGLLPSRTFRQPFRGATMVRANMGANPAVGPVGLSNRQGRLQAGVNALSTVYLPSNDDVRQMFTQPSARNRNPLSSVLGDA